MPKIKQKTKDELLDSLWKEMEKKYNMTQSDFDNFTQMSNDALSLDGPEWSFYEGFRYAFETLTTIGKYKINFFFLKLSILALPTSSSSPQTGLICCERAVWIKITIVLGVGRGGEGRIQISFVGKKMKCPKTFD